MKQTINKGIQFGLGFMGVLLITGMTFAAYSQLSDVSNGSTLTSTIWNQMIDNQDDFDTRITSLEGDNAGPVFSATVGTTTSSANGTWVIVDLATALIDTSSVVDIANDKFQPTIAGYYRIHSNLTINMTAPSAFTISSGIFKNGSLYRSSARLINYNAGFNDTVTVSDLIYLNGTSDYIDFRFQKNTSNAGTVSAASFVSGEFIRP